MDELFSIPFMFYQFDFVLDSEFLLEEELPFEHEHFHLNSRDWFWFVGYFELQNVRFTLCDQKDKEEYEHYDWYF